MSVRQDSLTIVFYVVYNLQKTKEEKSDSLRQTTQISSTFLEWNIFEELSLFLHRRPNE